MQFDPNAYGPEVRSLLALHKNGERLFPLTAAPCVERSVLVWQDGRIPASAVVIS